MRCRRRRIGAHLREDRQHRDDLRELRHELAVHLLQAVGGNEVHRHVHTRVLHLVQGPRPPRVLMQLNSTREQCRRAVLRATASVAVGGLQMSCRNAGDQWLDQHRPTSVEIPISRPFFCAHARERQRCSCVKPSLDSRPVLCLQVQALQAPAPWRGTPRCTS